jgi:hypothetical protein
MPTVLVEVIALVEMGASASSPRMELKEDATIRTASVPSVVVARDVFATSQESRTSFFNDRDRISLC